MLSHLLCSAAPRLLVLSLSPKQEFSFSLAVEREKPVASGTILFKVKVRSARSGHYVLDDDIVGLTIEGKDRTGDMKACLEKPSVSFEWNSRGQRAGAMSPLSFRKSMPADMAGVFSEAGLYLCEFPSTAVKAGDSWPGSTTATGGCTSGLYTLKGFRFVKGKEVADVEVTKIAMSLAEQVGPMKMTVDVVSGVPITVDYKVRGKKSGRISRFLQTWIRR